MAGIDLVVFDVGGVLGTNGWDTRERGAAIAKFGLDHDDFERRHHEAVDAWETGLTTMDQYLTETVFYEARDFTREAFRDFMFAQSVPNRPMLQLARAIRATDAYRMMTLNNESAELHEYRVVAFGLGEIFDAFLTSCYLAARKPDPVIYRRAFGVANADPARTVFIDDRPQNLEPARALGVHIIQAADVAAVRDGLAALGVVPTPDAVSSPSLS